MAKTASREKKDRGRHWQRAATRASILEAARRLIARVGTDNLSLTAVAREADFAPTTVFAYYANKNDLFLSVLAADLANFARTMREYGGPEEREISPEDEFVAPHEAGAMAAPMAPETYPAGVTEDAPRLRLVETQQFDPDIDAAAGEAPDWASQEEIATLLRDELARDAEPLPDQPRLPRRAASYSRVRRHPARTGGTESCHRKTRNTSGRPVARAAPARVGARTDRAGSAGRRKKPRSLQP